MILRVTLALLLFLAGCSRSPDVGLSAGRVIDAAAVRAAQ